MRRGEIWTVSPDPCQGHEQKSWRPVLIVSPDAFNRVTKVTVVVPITRGGGFARAAGFAVPLAETETTGIVRCDQPRALNCERGVRAEWKQRRKPCSMKRWRGCDRSSIEEAAVFADC